MNVAEMQLKNACCQVLSGPAIEGIARPQAESLWKKLLVEKSKVPCAAVLPELD